MNTLTLMQWPQILLRGEALHQERSQTPDENMEVIEFIIFKLCSYAQRSAIAQRKQGIEFETPHIDLANKAD